MVLQGHTVTLVDAGRGLLKGGQNDQGCSVRVRD